MSYFDSPRLSGEEAIIAAVATSACLALGGVAAYFHARATRPASAPSAGATPPRVSKAQLLELLESSRVAATRAQVICHRKLEVGPAQPWFSASCCSQLRRVVLSARELAGAAPGRHPCPVRTRLRAGRRTARRRLRGPPGDVAVRPTLDAAVRQGRDGALPRSARGGGRGAVQDRRRQGGGRRRGAARVRRRRRRRARGGRDRRPGAGGAVVAAGGACARPAAGNDGCTVPGRCCV